MTDNYHDTIAELRERIAWLESELGLTHRAEQMGVLCEAGCSPGEACVVMALYRSQRLVRSDVLFDQIDHLNGGECVDVIKVHVARIRARWGGDVIRTVPRYGYALTTVGTEIVHALFTSAGVSHSVAARRDAT